MWLLTSVLDEAQLSVDTIRDLYQKRWGIEVEFRGLQQTLNVTVHTPATALLGLLCQRNSVNESERIGTLIFTHQHESRGETGGNDGDSRPFNASPRNSG